MPRGLRCSIWMLPRVFVPASLTGHGEDSKGFTELGIPESSGLSIKVAEALSCMQPARRRSNPKLMLDEDEADDSIDEADPEDDVDPDADVDVEPTAELDDDLDLDSIINAAVPLPAALLQVQSLACSGQDRMCKRLHVLCLLAQP